MAGVVLVLVLPGSSSSPGRATTRSGTSLPATVGAVSTSSAATAPPATVAPPTTVPVTTTPPTTIDPGTLPQTSQLPSASDAEFTARINDLWRAVVDGRPAEAQPSFFPLSAYIQVKGISDPIHDYQTRLIPDFDQDVETLHAALGADAGSATFTGVAVPNAAEWIVPGVEYNKGSYWRVYGTTVTYTLAGESRSFPITSMISWRGEWYVVHLGAIR